MVLCRSTVSYPSTLSFNNLSQIDQILQGMYPSRQKLHAHMYDSIASTLTLIISQPQGKDKGITFTDSGTAAYIPQWKSPEIGFPLLSCPVDLIQDNLFEWNSPYHDYDYYDLTLDADAIMMRDTKGRSLTSNIFNRVVLYGN